MQRIPLIVRLAAIGLIGFCVGYKARGKSPGSSSSPIPEVTDSISIAQPDPATPHGKRFTRLRLERVVTPDKGGSIAQDGEWVITYWHNPDGEDRKQIAYVFAPLP